ncbi:hypothetical protein BDY24DRAFT_85126 [Mrakia frigida]|uniref:uncharacterized protein n=1 Tax=Mrakia frigida TaxID=29902 RepID=UPI003FCC0457
MKPSCSRCVRSGTECLWPLEVPRQALFQPYGGTKEEHVQPTASTSYLPAPAPSRTPSSSSNSPPESTRRPSSALNSTTSDSTSQPLPSQPEPQHQRPHPPLQVSLYTEPTASLEITFPDPQERFIAHNFLSLMNYLQPVAPHSPPVPSSAEPQTFSQIFPQMDVHRFLTTRGTSLASEALTLAFLSVGSVQLSYLHHQSAVRFLLDANTSLSTTSHENNRKYTTLGNTLYESSLGLIKASMAMLEVKAGQGGAGGKEEMMESLNTAASFLLLNRTLGGGKEYEEALVVSKSLVGLGGGPKRMLEEARSSGDKKRLRRVRSSLEHLVGYDLFSCLSSTRPPDCSFSSDPLASWYFDFAPLSNTPRSVSSEEWETVESLMGVSRGMMELLNRVNTLYSVSRPPVRDAPIEEVWIREGNLILAEVARWGNAFKDTQLVQYGSRLDYGNLIYSAFFKIIIYLEIHRLPIWSPDVVWASNEVVRLIHECRRSNGYLMGYMIPLCWAGSTMNRPDDRGSVRKAMNYFRPLVCYTVEKAWETLEKVWVRMDEGDKSASWRSVASEEGGGLLLM